MRAYVWLYLTDLALGVVGYRHIVSRFDHAPRRESAISPDAILRAQRYAHWIEVAARHHVVAARCLHRSLVLQLWLRREGVPSALRIGVRTDRGALAAHAWVEILGKVVNDSPAAVATFAPLARPAQVAADRGSEIGDFTARRGVAGAAWSNM